MAKRVAAGRLVDSREIRPRSGRSGWEKSRKRTKKRLVNLGSGGKITKNGPCWSWAKNQMANPRIIPRIIPHSFSSEKAFDLTARAQSVISGAMQRLIFAFCAVVAFGGLRAPAAAWQPGAGHTQVPIWPGAAPDEQPVAGPEDTATGTGPAVAGTRGSSGQRVAAHYDSLFTQGKQHGRRGRRVSRRGLQDSGDRS